MYYLNNDEQPEQKMKICTCKTCQHEGVPQLVGEFNKDKNRKGGLNSKCKDCVKQYNKSFYQANREKRLKQVKLWITENVNIDVSIIYAIFSKHHNKIVYVGSSLTTMERRACEHKKDSFTNNSQQAIYKAMRQFGWDNFSFVLLTDEYSSHFTEDYFIQMLKPEFNARGGDKIRRTRFTPEQLKAHLATENILSEIYSVQNNRMEYNNV